MARPDDIGPDESRFAYNRRKRFEAAETAIRQIELGGNPPSREEVAAALRAVVEILKFHTTA